MAESIGGRSTGGRTGWTGSRFGAHGWGRRLGALTVAAALLAAGCSGDDDGDGTTAPDVPAADADAGAGSDAASEDPLATVGVVLDLASQLQLETFWSAAEIVGADGAREVLDGQRARTDEALATFRQATEGRPPGDAQELETAQLRLEQLEVVRRAVDEGHGTAPQRIGDYRAISTTLVELVAAMPDHGDDADEVRALGQVGELARHTDASAGARALLTFVVAEGTYVRWEDDGTAVPCAGVPVSDPECRWAVEVVRAHAGVGAASERLTLAASPELLQMLRNAQAAGGDFEAVNALVAAAEGRGAVADVVTFDEWMDAAPGAIEALQAAQAEALAQLSAG